MRLGKVVKSNSHCDYVVQLDDEMEVEHPPRVDDYGFGTFVKLEEPGVRHWAVGLVYNSQLFNPMFLSNGPRLSSDPDPLFAPDLISETRTLLGVVLLGCLNTGNGSPHGVHGIPRLVVPVNAKVFTMTAEEIHYFHVSASGKSQFCYYSHLLQFGGSFAAQLTQQVLRDLAESGLFANGDQRALEILGRELSWKSTMGAMR